MRLISTQKKAFLDSILFTLSYSYGAEALAFNFLLILLSGLLFWSVIKKIKHIINIHKEEPVIVINEVGIKYMEDRIRNWTEIERIVVTREFDLKYFTLFLKDKQSMSYNLNIYEISDLDDLKIFKPYLDRFFSKVELNES